MQLAHDFYVEHRLLQTGYIAEVARVEPYTYTHFNDAPALMAHQGLPLGNPNGPNSLIIDWTLYAKLYFSQNVNGSSIFLALLNKWLWKGSDNGSHIDDPYKTVRKHFIHGARLRYSLTPTLNFSAEHISFTGEYSFFGKKYVNIRMMVGM
jgi:hypothetical protein